MLAPASLAGVCFLFVGFVDNDKNKHQPYAWTQLWPKMYLVRLEGEGGLLTCE